MDYAKAVFALEVRKLAANYLNRDMPPGISDSEKQKYWVANYPNAVKQVITEVHQTWKLIDLLVKE